MQIIKFISAGVGSILNIGIIDTLTSQIPPSLIPKPSLHKQGEERAWQHPCEKLSILGI